MNNLNLYKFANTASNSNIDAQIKAIQAQIANLNKQLAALTQQKSQQPQQQKQKQQQPQKHEILSKKLQEASPEVQNKYKNSDLYKQDLKHRSNADNYNRLANEAEKNGDKKGALDFYKQRDNSIGLISSYGTKTDYIAQENAAAKEREAQFTPDQQKQRQTAMWDKIYDQMIQNKFRSHLSNLQDLMAGDPNYANNAEYKKYYNAYIKEVNDYIKRLDSVYGHNHGSSGYKYDLDKAAKNFKRI